MVQQVRPCDDASLQICSQHQLAGHAGVVFAEQQANGEVVVGGQRRDEVGGQVRVAGAAPAQADVRGVHAAAQQIRIGGGVGPGQRSQAVLRRDVVVDGGFFFNDPAPTEIYTLSLLDDF